LLRFDLGAAANLQLDNAPSCPVSVANYVATETPQERR
jgi:hypothetical protein